MSKTEVIASITIRIGIGQIVVTEDNAEKIVVGLSTNRITGEETSEET